MKIMRSYCDDKKVTIHALMFDGLLIQDTKLFDRAEVSKLIKQELKFDINLAFKSHNPTLIDETNFKSTDVQADFPCFESIVQQNERVEPIVFDSPDDSKKEKKNECKLILLKAGMGAGKTYRLKEGRCMINFTNDRTAAF